MNADFTPAQIAILDSMGGSIACDWYNETVPHGGTCDPDYDLSAQGDVDAVEAAMRHAKIDTEARAEAFRVVQAAYRRWLLDG